MCSVPARSPARSLVARGRAALATVVDSGMLRVHVPPTLGGSGGTLHDLAAGGRALAARHPAAGWVLWAQRLAIEALLQSPNIALREHLLADLLNGDRAGTLPLAPWFAAGDRVAAGSATATPATALVAMGGDPGMRLFGQLPCVPNLQWQGYALVAPVQVGPGQPHWVLLRGEEDRLRAGMDLGAPCPQGSRCAALTLDGVFFRADEELAGPDLPRLLQPTAQALYPCLAAPEPSGPCTCSDTTPCH